jgi:hypothetical protein
VLCGGGEDVEMERDDGEDVWIELEHFVVKPASRV